MTNDKGNPKPSPENHVGVAFEKGGPGFEVGRRIAQAAIADGGIENPQFVLAFCSGESDEQGFFDGLRDVVGPDAPIVGGATVGVITREAQAYLDKPYAAAVFELGSTTVDVFSAGDLDVDERQAGINLSSQFTISEDLHSCLLFYDSIKVPASGGSPPIMNASPPILEGIHENFPERLPIVGAGVCGHIDFSGASPVFTGYQVKPQHIVGLLLSGDCQPFITIMHGCTPQDGILRTVTKSEKEIVYEMDDEPVVDIIDNMYGSTDWQKQIPLKRLTIGINYGEKFSEYQEKNYVNRLITGPLPGGDGISIFEADLPVGTEVEFMLRDTYHMITSARENTEALFQKVKESGRHPFFGLYIDCAGRGGIHSGSMTEEALEVVHFFNKYDTPLLGLYSGVEIGPVNGHNRGHAWTGILMLMTTE